MGALLGLMETRSGVLGAHSRVMKARQTSLRHGDLHVSDGGSFGAMEARTVVKMAQNWSHDGLPLSQN